MLAWSVVQDIVVVGTAVVLLSFVGLGERGPLLTALVLFAAFGVFAAVAGWVMPKVLVALHAEPDLFLIVSVAGALAIAAIGDFWFGVPLALAAFIAGLAISESPHASKARQRLLPFRDLFAVLFFVAVGSLLNPSALATPLPAAGL